MEQTQVRPDWLKWEGAKAQEGEEEAHQAT